MEVTLLGTGDTTGTPTVDCDCETCAEARDPGDERRRQLRDRGATLTPSGGVERTRFSIHVRNQRTGEALLLDASPDFRYQFLRENLSVPDAAVISHIHFDHCHGLGNVFRLTRDLPVHAASQVDPVTGESVAATVRRQYDYLDALDVRGQAPLETFVAAGFDVRLVPVDHPPLACYGVAIEDPETGAKLSVSGDTTYDVPEASREALADPDLLIADGIVHADFCEHHPRGGQHYADGVARTFGTKHMTFEGARALAEDLDSDTLRVVHVSHFPPPSEAFGSDLAVDGEQFTL